MNILDHCLHIRNLRKAFEQCKRMCYMFYIDLESRMPPVNLVHNLGCFVNCTSASFRFQDVVTTGAGKITTSYYLQSTRPPLTDARGNTIYITDWRRHCNLQGWPKMVFRIHPRISRLVISRLCSTNCSMRLHLLTLQGCPQLKQSVATTSDSARKWNFASAMECSLECSMKSIICRAMAPVLGSG